MNIKLPSSPESEIWVIGSILIDSNVFHRIDWILEPKDFYIPCNIIIFSILKDMINNWEKVDLLTVRQKLEDLWKLEDVWGSKWIIEYTNTIFTSENIESYAKIVKEKSIRRKAISAWNNIMLLAYDDTKDVNDMIFTWENLIKNLPTISQDTAVTMTEFFENYHERLEIIQKWWSFWYKSWIKVLDANADWIQPWTVTRLNAYTNHGKTRLAIWIMCNLLKQWVSCGFFSTEVTKEHFFPIIVWTIQKVNDRDIKYWNVAVEWDIISKLPLKFYQDKRKLDEIITLSKKNKFQVVFIDFCQNIDAGFRWDIFTNMSEYASRIQQFAIENNVAIFDLSQINVEWAKVTSSRVIPSKWSGALAESADVSIVIERKEFDSKTTVLDFYIRKNKYWPIASCELNIDYNQSQYVEITKL